ncbi:MAG: Aromatic amino acid permease [Parcubacteria group bacterium GW2011_GWA2_48_9]|nr:MAG: Aromatic amino acid permease [Parcubacteria group bacterium GW2011_GWA2_48_9]
MEWKKFFLGLAVLSGTVIGVGIFGLPYIASRVGFIPTLVYCVVLGGIVYFIHSAYAYVVVIGFTGSLLAYLIVGGGFLSDLFSSTLFPLPDIFGVLIFFSIGATLVLRGRKSIASTELFFLAIFIIIVTGLVIAGWKKIEFSNLNTFYPENLLLPFGAVMFSFWGSSVIPEIRDIVGVSGRVFSRVLVAGLFVSLTIYLLFVFLVLGITGSDTSIEAISGLTSSLGDGVITLGYVFGFITTFTSFLALGLSITNTYRYDFGVRKFYAWLLACVVPLALYFFGLNDFIWVISLIGGILLGFEGLLILAMYRKAKKKFEPEKARSPLWIILVGTLFGVGVLAEIYYFIKDII